MVPLTGLATVVLEWHRPSDVVGSVLLGVVVGVAAARWAVATAETRVPGIGGGGPSGVRRVRTARCVGDLRVDTDGHRAAVVVEEVLGAAWSGPR